MGKRRSYDAGEHWKVIENAGLGCVVYGSWFDVLVNGLAVPGALGILLPRSGRVSIVDLAKEIARAEAYRDALHASQHHGFLRNSFVDL